MRDVHHVREVTQSFLDAVGARVNGKAEQLNPFSGMADGVPEQSLAKRFEMSQQGAVYAVNKGEKIAKDRELRLLE